MKKVVHVLHILFTVGLLEFFISRIFDILSRLSELGLMILKIFKFATCLLTLKPTYSGCDNKRVLSPWDEIWRIS